MAVRFTKTCAALAAWLLPAAIALGQQPGDDAERFSAIDRNQDGYVAPDEARDAQWRSRFGELDRDNDGRLSEAEYVTLEDSGASAAAGASSINEEKKE
jgi:hypothetical protein